MLRISGPKFAQRIAQHVVQLVERCTTSRSNIEYAMPIGVQFAGSRENVRLYNVRNPDKVASGLAITVDLTNLATQHRVNPLRNHGGVAAKRILPRAEHVEIPESHCLEPIGPA